MKYAVNESAPLPISVPYKQYLYGTNEYIPIVDSRNTEMNIHDVMEIFKHPKAKVELSSGKRVDYIASRKIVVPVNKENVLKSGIVSAENADKILDSIVLTIPKGKDYISKPELFMLDFLAGYDWSRPLQMLNMGGEINVGQKEYLVYEGYSYKLVPFKNKPSNLAPGIVDSDDLYRKMTSVYRFDALSREDYFIDYQNYYTHLGVMSIRQLFVTAAKVFQNKGENERALEMLDKMQEVMKPYPLDAIPLGFSNNNYMVTEAINIYFELGEREKALDLTARYSEELLRTTDFYMGFGSFSENECETCAQYIFLLSDRLEKNGEKKLASQLEGKFKTILDSKS